MMRDTPKKTEPSTAPTMPRVVDIEREAPACPNEADPWVARVLVVNEPACWPSVVVWATAATDR